MNTMEVNLIAEYKLVAVNREEMQEEVEELNKTVNELISDGWQPFGFPYAYGSKRNYSCQAMVRYSKDC